MKMGLIIKEFNIFWNDLQQFLTTSKAIIEAFYNDLIKFLRSLPKNDPTIIMASLTPKLAMTNLTKYDFSNSESIMSAENG